MESTKITVGSRRFEDLYEFYSGHEATEGFNIGAAMTRFLDIVLDLLRERAVYFSTSHLQLWLSSTDVLDENRERPAIRVYWDGSSYGLAFVESWDDGPYLRSREDRIRCREEHVRAAFIELLNRLKAPAA